MMDAHTRNFSTRMPDCSFLGVLTYKDHLKPEDKNLSEGKCLDCVPQLQNLYFSVFKIVITIQF